MSITIPTAPSLTYNGSSQTGVAANSAYTVVSGKSSATDAGSYSATLQLVNSTNYKWSNGSTSNQTVSWSISKASRTITMSASKSITMGSNDTLSFSYNGYTGDGISATVKSNNTSYLTVSISNTTSSRNGTITLTPVKAGSASFTLTVPATTNYNEASKNCSVTINDLTMTVTYNANSGNITNLNSTYTTRTVTYGKTYGDAGVPEAYRSGYTFNGWFTATTGGSKVDASTKVTQKVDHSLWAQWSQATVTVTFNGNGGNITYKQKEYVIGETYGSLSSAWRTNYIFDGWYTERTGGRRIYPNYTVDANITILYAHWREQTVTVTFHGNGGSPDNETQTYTVGGTYGSFPSVTRENYTFDGWYTTSTGGTNIIASDTVTVDRTDLYAHWTYVPTPTPAKTCTVTFYGNGGNPNEQTRTYTVGDYYGELPTVTRSGYTFDGWWTTQTGGIKINANDTVNEYYTRAYAHWSTGSVTSPVPGGGGGSSSGSGSNYCTDQTHNSWTCGYGDNPLVPGFKCNICGLIFYTSRASASDPFVYPPAHCSHGFTYPHYY